MPHQRLVSEGALLWRAALAAASDGKKKEKVLLWDRVSDCSMDDRVLLRCDCTCFGLAAWTLVYSCVVIAHVLEIVGGGYINCMRLVSKNPSCVVIAHVLEIDQIP